MNRMNRLYDDDMWHAQKQGLVANDLKVFFTSILIMYMHKLMTMNKH